MRGRCSRLQVQVWWVVVINCHAVVISIASGLEEIVCGPNLRRFFFLFSFFFSFLISGICFKIQNMRGALAMATKTL